MSLLNYSVTLVGRTIENVNDVQQMFNEVRATVNDLDNDNLAVDASIDWSKINAPNGTIPVGSLDDGAAAQVIVCNGSGQARYVDMGGEAVINNAGNITLKQNVKFLQQTADYFPGSGPGLVPGLQTTALAAGAWLIFAKLECESLGAKLTGAQFQIERSGVTGLGTFKISTPGNGDVGYGGTIGFLLSGGADTARVTNTNPSPPSGSGAAVAVRGVLVAIKVA